MTDNTDTIPWVSFCMSTYQRPGFLESQLKIIAEQSFANFEVIISDNDPCRSAEPVVEAMGDNRFRYYNNGVNLGMIQSFNKSIERADAEFIVMITDDDPVDKHFLSEIYEMFQENPTCSLYGGFLRRELKTGEIEIISAVDFITEILDVNKTPALLWSSCVMRKTNVLEVGKMPDYGSPHFADHALIAMVGSIAGGMVKNKMFSTLSSHESNFSKSNFQYYPIGCKGFYKLMENFGRKHINRVQEKKAVIIHLGKWFFGCVFTLKKYFILTKNVSQHDAIVTSAQEILRLPYMRRYRAKYLAKSVIFEIKKILGILKL